MTTLRREVLAAVVMALLIGAVPAFAAGPSITILEASGDVWLSAFADFSPTPVGWTTWEHGTADGPTFDAALLIPDTEFQWGYAVHCGVDGLSGLASWADLDPDPVSLFSVGIEMELSCLVEVQGNIGLIADRAAEGNFGAPLEHRDQAVRLTYPDHTTVEIIGSAVGTTHAELLLGPGQYRISISASYLERDEQDAFSSHVTLDWVDAALPAEGATWSGVKALFR